MMRTISCPAGLRSVYPMFLIVLWLNMLLLPMALGISVPIQDMIDSASDGEIIVLEQKTYYEVIDFKGKNIIICSTNPRDLNVVSNTVLDGSGESGPLVTFSGSEGTSCVLEGITIQSAVSSSDGGGILGNGTLATIQNNIITMNSSTGNGAGICDCDGMIRNNMIGSNDCRGSGGGLYDCDGLIVNNVIYNNYGLHGGAGAFGCEGFLLNNTFINNISSSSGSGLKNCPADIANCIFWSNYPLINQLDESSTPSYSCIQGWILNGLGNITLDPQLVDPFNMDFHLGDLSPCIDAGDPLPEMNDGCLPPGKGGTRNDMGAYGGPHNCQWWPPTPTPTPSPTPAHYYQVVDLGTLDGSVSNAYDINEKSGIVGKSVNAGGYMHAFLSTENAIYARTMNDLGTLGGERSEAWGINNHGHVVGQSEITTGSQYAFLHDGVRMNNLGTLGGEYSLAYAVNDSGQVVGESMDFFEQTHACLWEKGKRYNIGDQIPGFGSGASDINKHGFIVGWSQEGEGVYAFLFKDGITTDVGHLGSGFSWANALNDLNQVVGVSENSEFLTRAFLYRDGVIRDLGTLGDDYSQAFDINNHGQVVGESLLDDSYDYHAFLFENGAMFDLNHLIPYNPDWNLRSARGINDLNQIVGYGLHLDQERAFLLEPLSVTPTPTPSPSPTTSPTPSPTPTASFTPTPTPTATPPYHPPWITGAALADSNGNMEADPGETITLVFNQGILVNPALLSSRSFYLPVEGDSLGIDGFHILPGPHSSLHLQITLGSGANLTILGDFASTDSAAGASSGIDLMPFLPPEAIQSFLGVPAIDRGIPGFNDDGMDIKIGFLCSSGIIGPEGGILDLPIDPNARYTNHSLFIPANALPVSKSDGILFTMSSPEFPGASAGFVRIQSNRDDLISSPPMMLTLEYFESDIDLDLGFAEPGMRIHQLVEDPPGVFSWKPLSGKQVVNLENNTVTGWLNRLTPYDIKRRSPVRSSPGDAGIFGNIPGSTIEENSVYIKPGGGGNTLVTAASLSPGSGGFYTIHYLEFPGYELTTETDPARIKVTIKQAILLDRFAMGTDVGFPASSSSVFVIKTENTGGGFPFTDSVNMRVQFMDGSLNDFNDLVDFNDQTGDKANMALVKDIKEGVGANFILLDGVDQTVKSAPGGGYVEAAGVPGLTDSTGQGVWGVVVGPPKPIKLWMVY